MTSAALATSLIAGVSGCGGSNSSTATATAAPVTAPQGDLKLFATEAEAKHVCPKDEIVWLNPVTGIYHVKGTTFYGHTKRGNYVCRKAADAAGDRDSKAG